MQIVDVEAIRGNVDLLDDLQDELPEILCLDGSRNMVDLFLQKGREQFAAESLVEGMMSSPSVSR